MKVSIRSWVLLLCSTMAPITVVSFRADSLAQRRTIAGLLNPIFGYGTGLVPMFTFFAGILCFVPFLVSLVFDYLRSKGLHV